MAPLFVIAATRGHLSYKRYLSETAPSAPENESRKIEWSQTMAPQPQAVYRIGVRAHLDPSWSGYFEGLTIIHQPNGETIIVGPVRDQAALFGVLMKVRDLSHPAFGEPGRI